jgi:hypothetical protein
VNIGNTAVNQGKPQSISAARGINGLRNTADVVCRALPADDELVVESCSAATPEAAQSSASQRAAVFTIRTKAVVLEAKSACHEELGIRISLTGACHLRQAPKRGIVF